MARATFLLLFLLLSISAANCCAWILRDNSSSLVFEGIDYNEHESPSLLLNSLSYSITCEPTYGFLPCASGIWGEIFLILVYEYLLFLGENYISAGSDLLFQILGPGIFGASAFHVLGSLPEAILVLVTGISGGKETSQKHIMMGMGLLTGSTIMLLTLLWGSVVFVGNYHLSQTSSPSSMVEHTKRSKLTDFGVSTDIETCYTARIMLLSMIPFVIVQLPELFNSSAFWTVAIIISMIISISFLIIYCFYQVFQPWIQDRRLEYLLIKFIQKKFSQVLLNRDGTPNITLIKELFHKIDHNNDTFISASELRALILGIQFEEEGLEKEDLVGKVIEEFDVSGNAHIDEAEFIIGISQWLEAKQSKDLQKYQERFMKKTDEEQILLEDERDTDKKKTNKSMKTYLKPLFLLLFGTAILSILALPLVESVRKFSTAVDVPSFFTSFIVLPLATNYRRAVSAIESAKQKNQRSASLTLSEIYGAVFMKNIVSLSIFLALVCAWSITWDFSAEVLVVFIVCTVMGLFTSFSTTFPLWTCFLAFLLYPFSLFLVYILTYTLGWS